MAVYFLDSSAVVKFHVAETGTAWVQSLLLAKAKDGTFTNEIFIANITEVEVTAALVRRARAANSPVANLAATLTVLGQQVGTILEPVALTNNHIVSAVTLAQKHALRGYDAVQLAIAFQLNNERLAAKLPSLTLIAADIELLAAAQAEGLPTDDPNLHP